MIWLHRARAFWTKFGNDWCMNLAGLLAYNFLTAIFPLILGILALGAYVLPDATIRQIASLLDSALPSGTTLNINFYDVLQGFHRASGVTAIISLALLLWTGSNLFGVMENCFSIIYRTKTRGFLQQKLMSVAMLILLAVLAPLAVLASSVIGSASALTQALGALPGFGVLVVIGGYIVGVAIAFVLFFCIYLVVPNLPINPRDAWRGALFAAVLFEIVNLVFPLYVRNQHNQFGNIGLLLAILTFWFWVISLITMLGAEMNSFAALGQRAAPGDLPTVVQAADLRARASGQTKEGDAPAAAPPARRPAPIGPAAVAALAAIAALLAVLRRESRA